MNFVHISTSIFNEEETEGKKRVTGLETPSKQFIKVIYTKTSPSMNKNFHLFANSLPFFSF